MATTGQGIRLNKYLASCGVGSRRACDAIIQEGRVYVNNAVCINLATRVVAEDVVRVGRKVVRPRSTEVILLNKPRGLVCTSSDELNRETVYSILPPKYRHLKHVGRLDMDSEGLLVMTNDGELALSLTHPRQKVEKEYLVTLDQSFSNEVIDQLIAGVHTPEGRASAKSVRRVSSRRVRVVLVTGMKRQIRMMFEALHLKVTKLVRVRIGTLVGEGLELGKCRVLDEEDIQALQTNPEPAKGRSDRGFDAGKKPGLARKPGRRPAKKMGRPGGKRKSPRTTGNSVKKRRK
ncbi:rRNA pseudouridine synthase [Verrucomicrobiaceae bacterium N1E253]|uniref:Pseudouridine synthase n=1 Tax=Oceaniferula marina TaxID=2748318 RepID=A0A851GHT5_9BACT|nr:pseudouridine synthase [Oceaniferula marina]NWK56759.1 rRNA pseudouridine synthase [Oceaniferula marina]